MALTKLNNYSNADTNILEMQITEDASYIGKNQVSLTNRTTTTVPAIAAGSIVEVNGALLRADTEQAIGTTDPVTSATVADGAVYIMIDGTNKTAYFTATAPVWSDTKQGWYGATTWANWRYVGQCTKSSTSYYGKVVIPSIGSNKPIVIVTPVGNQTYTGPSGTAVTIGFGTEVVDIAGDYSAGAFRPTVSGVYQLNLLARINTGGVGSAGRVYIRNGAAPIDLGSFYINPPDTVDITASISIMANLTVGAVVSCWIVGTGSFSWTIYAGIDSTCFSAHLIRPAFNI